jgi:sugar phosphate permease
MPSLAKEDELGEGSERGFHLSRRRKSSSKQQEEYGERHVEEHLMSVAAPAAAAVAAPLTSSLSSSSSSAYVLPTSSSQQQQQQHLLQYQQEGAARDATTTTVVQEEILISIDEAIERLGTGRFQWFILIASGLCFCGDAIQFVLLSFITMIVQQQWHLSNSITASITSCIFAGASCGTLVLGPAADAVGRRPIFLLSAAMITVFGMGMAMTQNYWTLIFMVFLVGFGVGGSIVPFDVLGT